MNARVFSITVVFAVVAAFGLAAAARAESLSLAEAVRRAAEQAAPVQIARSRVEERRAQVAAARAALFPSLSGAASQGERTFNLNSFGIPFPGSEIGPLIGPVPAFDARVRAVQTIAGVSDWRHVQSARADVAVSRAEALTRAQEAAESAALRYVNVERTSATSAARRSDLDIAVELDSLASVQVRAGTAANIDVLRSRTQLAAARGELSLAENELERSRIELARALGAGPDARFETADSLGKVVASDVPEEEETVVRFAIERRSEIGAERARLEHARAERRAIIAERIPRLDATADYGASGLHVGDAIATRQVAVQLTWPFFDGTRREARIREQAAIMDASEIEARDLSQQVSAEVQEALLDVASGGEQQTIAQERVDLALQQLAEARIRFRNGVAGNIEVIEAQSALVRARDAEIAARAATATARIHLARAAGVAETVR